MKKTHFLEQLSAVSKEAYRFLSEILPEGEIVFLDPENTEEFYESLYEMPRVVYVSKHGFYEEYGVYKVIREKEKISLHTEGIGESLGEPQVFDITEIDDPNLCQLVDMVSQHLFDNEIIKKESTQ